MFQKQQSLGKKHAPLQLGSFLHNSLHMSVQFFFVFFFSGAWDPTIYHMIRVGSSYNPVVHAAKSANHPSFLLWICSIQIQN